jgi:hypothetical protein
MIVLYSQACLQEVVGPGVPFCLATSHDRENSRIFDRTFWVLLEIILPCSVGFFKFFVCLDVLEFLHKIAKQK